MSLTIDEVKKLAELGKIELSDEEIVKYQGEIDTILQYVDTIREVSMPEGGLTTSPHLALENIMREDKNPIPAGMYTEALLAQAPRRKGNSVEVRKIL